MKDRKKGAEDVLPENQKNKLRNMPDHIQSPMNDLEDKRETLQRAEEEE